MISQILRFTPALLLTFSLAGSPAFAGPMYTLTDLGTLLGGSASMAQAINANGYITGWSSTSGSPNQAYRSDGATMTPLGTLGGNQSAGWGINDSNTVVGNAQTAGGEFRPFIDNGGGMQDLGTLGGQEGYARDINNAGQVVGDSQTGSGAFHATLWDGGVTDLGTLGGDHSYGMAVNASGVAVGFSLLADNLTNAAFMWDSFNGMQNLGTLGGSTAEAHDINDVGTVVGFSELAGGEVRAFMKTAGGTMLDLGSLGGDDGSRAFAVNASNQVVGHSSYASGMPMPHAFLFTDGILHDLNDLVVDAASWTLMEARDINDSGQIVGFGMVDGDMRAFLLTETSIDQVPTPAALGLLLPLLPWVRRRR